MPLPRAKHATYSPIHKGSKTNSIIREANLKFFVFYLQNDDHEIQVKENRGTEEPIAFKEKE